MTSAMPDHGSPKIHAKDRGCGLESGLCGSVTHIATYYTLIGQVFAHQVCIYLPMGCIIISYVSA